MVPVRCSLGKCVHAHVCVCVCVNGGRACSDGAQPWGVPEGPLWALSLLGSSRRPGWASLCPAPFLSARTRVSLHHSLSPPPSSPTHRPPSLSPWLSLPACSAPRISLFLPSPRSSSPGSLHPPSPSYASFCPSDPSPSQLCLLLLRGGCDPRNISEGEEGVSRSRAERDRLGRRSERGSLLQPGRGVGLVHLSGPKFKSCLFLTSAG